MKMRFTKQELIDHWLEQYPQDVTSPDLEFNAVAGYVETKDGYYITYKEWEADMQKGASQ